jgi:hypothetical protein
MYQLFLRNGMISALVRFRGRACQTANWLPSRGLASEGAGKPVGDVIATERHVVCAHVLHASLTIGEDLELAAGTARELLEGLVSVVDRAL